MKTEVEQNEGRLEQLDLKTKKQCQYFFPRGQDKDVLAELRYEGDDEVFLDTDDVQQVFKMPVSQIPNFSKVTMFLEGNVELSGHFVEKFSSIVFSRKKWPSFVEFPLYEGHVRVKLVGMRLDEVDLHVPEDWRDNDVKD